MSNSLPTARWRSRTPTRSGHIDPPNWRPMSETRIGNNGPSTVAGRVEEAEHDRRRREHNVHLQPGTLVIRDRAPYRIVEIREQPHDLWPEKFEHYWRLHHDLWAANPGSRPEPTRETWRDRPVVVVLTPDGGGEERHMIGPASHDWPVLPEHYAVCRSCGELPPCREEELDRVVSAQLAKSERLLAIPAGNCMGCGEAISSRQKSVRFPGPNLWRPDLAAGTARFHARGECAHWVDAYRGQWIALGAPASAEQPALPLGEGDAA
ncbi:hypothetical protein ACIRVF_08125 [Kitasatospora sp. NPDC101157]|uniref:hypothetical protein n=1 Tax=Kitasatospora sp. NPDC101157 TaxID=3364098 RepID=UPI0038178EFB